MDDKFKKATARITCGGKFGTAFLIDSSHAITAYHVVKRSVKGCPINLVFPLLGESGDRSAQLLNTRDKFNTGIDFAILQLDEPIENIETFQLTAKELTSELSWSAYGLPSTREITGGQSFKGDVSMSVKQHISQYDIDLDCIKPVIIDPKYVVSGASGSAVMVDDEVVAILSHRMPGGSLGAVSIKIARDLLNEYNIPFKDDTKSELDKILEMYSIKIKDYLKNNMNLPFESKLDNDLINNSYFNGFFDMSTWRSTIINQISMISKEANSNRIVREKVKELHDICQFDLSYEEFKTTMREKNDWILREIPDDETTKDIRPLLSELNSLLNKRYNKVLMLTGESGSGKTHLLKTILSSNKIQKGLGNYSIRIPINVNDIEEKGFEEELISRLNHFLATNFSDITDINEFITNHEKKGIKFRVIFIIDNLHILFNSNAKIYNDIKKTIKSYTKNDWISWCISINELDQYLIMDNSNFLKEYCFSNTSENDALNLFVNMSSVNNKNGVCYKILNNHGIGANIIDELPDNTDINIINNIKMLMQNPLICHVYVKTVSNHEKEFYNICYFDFIKRYSEVKKTEMKEHSKRNLSSNEKDADIDDDINKVVDLLIKNKKLTYLKKETDQLFPSNECYEELLSVHLVSKRFRQIQDPLGERTTALIDFVFPLYWGFKILFYFRMDDNWAEFSSLRKSFPDLENELFTYELLYLDMDIENNIKILTEEILHSLESYHGKELLFFVAVKTSVKCRGIIFNELLEREKLFLNKKETFGLLYFLLHINARVDKKCEILGRNLDRISKYELGVYLESLCKKMFSELKDLEKLKRCISEFICSGNTEISSTIGEIAAKNFARLVDGFPLEDVIDIHLINFLSNNLEKINETKNKQSGFTYIDYFLRFLFRILIENSNDDRFLLHKILLNKNLYYLDEEEGEKFKPIAHILRSNSAIAYGSYYKQLSPDKKKIFKGLYIKCIENLLKSDLTSDRKLAFHFISNTLRNPEDQNLSLENEFIPLLNTIYEDERLNEFNEGRKCFYERNINTSSE
ncbi:trypsin-like serine protease (plasmid) [Priestia megaterium]|uniref:trypsin-like serine peptidase n=1 Tax=Priestia megaterium TaxID=1404 RepID=UPI003877FB3B